MSGKHNPHKLSEHKNHERRTSRRPSDHARPKFNSEQWLDAALTRMKVTDDADARKRGVEAIDNFIKASIQPGHVVNKDVETSIKLWISAIDQKLSTQLNEILHHPTLQKLEGTWARAALPRQPVEHRRAAQDPRVQRDERRDPHRPRPRGRVRHVERRSRRFTRKNAVRSAGSRSG